MVNKHLQRQHLEAVNNQIRLNDPPSVKLTLGRLIDSGYSREAAKKMIAAVLVDEMFYVLQGKRSFDEARYEKMLHALGRDESQTPGDSADAASWVSIAALLEAIAQSGEDFPREELEAIIDREAEAVPVLLDHLDQIRQNPELYRDEEDSRFPSYLVLVLAELGANAAYPMFVDLLSLREDQIDDLFGEFILEIGSRVLASLCDGDIGLIKSLAANRHVEMPMRTLAVDSLVILAAQGAVDRDEVITYLDELLHDRSVLDDPVLTAFVIGSCCDLYPKELYETIAGCYRQNVVATGVVALEDVDDVLTLTEDEVLRELRSNPEYQFIDDAVAELEDWFELDDDPLESSELWEEPDWGDEESDQWEDPDLWDEEPPRSTPIVRGPKIGRNEPCPCGSGKKFKKCCGR